MADKTYSAREAAMAVLAKAQELLAKTDLAAKPASKVAEGQSGMHTVGYYSSTPFEKSESLDCGFEPFQKMEKADVLHNNVAQRRQSRAKDYKARGDMTSHKIAIEGAKASHKEQLNTLKDQPKPNLPKSEEMDKHGLSPEQIRSKMSKGTAQPAPSLALSEKNPDEKQDAQLGEEIEGLCEQHMLDNKDAERKEGHKIVKSESCKMCKHGLSPAEIRAKMKKSELEDLYEILAKIETLEKSETKDVNEIGTKFVSGPDKMNKAENKEAPSNPMKPKIEEEQAPQRDAENFETQSGHSNTPADHREAEQAAPQSNPKEQAEGNNPPAGTVPGKGVHKLSFFMGHRHHKKNGMKKGIALS